MSYSRRCGIRPENPCRFFALNLLPQWKRVIDELGGAPAHVFANIGALLCARLLRMSSKHAIWGYATRVSNRSKLR